MIVSWQPKWSFELWPPRIFYCDLYTSCSHLDIMRYAFAIEWRWCSPLIEAQAQHGAIIEQQSGRMKTRNSCKLPLTPYDHIWWHCIATIGGQSILDYAPEVQIEYWAKIGHWDLRFPIHSLSNHNCSRVSLTTLCPMHGFQASVVVCCHLANER